MSIGYISTLEYLKNRINTLSLETQEIYFIEKLDFLLKYIREKLEMYSDSKLLADTYFTLVQEFKSVLEKITEYGNAELLNNIYSDIEVEIERLDKKICKLDNYLVKY